MYYSSDLEHILSGSYIRNSNSQVTYFSKNLKNQRFLMMIENRFAIYRHIDENYTFKNEKLIKCGVHYEGKSNLFNYESKQEYLTSYLEHSFTPQIFLKPSRPKSRFVVDISEVNSIVKETFQTMTNQRLPENISINILPIEEFKAAHSRLGSWSNGIIGFSINGKNKRIFAKENHLDEIIMVIGHEIGHVLTETLPNNHDEEAKAFAFSIEWANTIKRHNIANLGLNIKDELDFQPARNGLHDVSLSFVNLMLQKGRKAIELHNDLVKRYVSIFNLYPIH